MNSIKIGSNVDSWCGRCKLVLAHTVEAVVGNDIKRVHCNTCQAQHGYRGVRETAVKEKTPRRVGSSGSQPGMARASHYDVVMQNRDIGSARTYSFREHYDAGHVLNHIQFGIGIVTADKGANKIEVLFKCGPKVLVHDRV